ncbi:MAG: CsbD family protein [Rhodanobacteraceae bacterium]
MMMPSAIISSATVMRMKTRAALRAFILGDRDWHSLVADEIRFRSMNSSSQDKVEGAAKEAVGTVKEKTGEAVGNPDLQDRGTAEKVEGKVQQKVGDVKKVFDQ